jgi:hypothetical protein
MKGEAQALMRFAGARLHQSCSNHCARGHPNPAHIGQFKPCRYSKCMAGFTYKETA